MHWGQDSHFPLGSPLSAWFWIPLTELPLIYGACNPARPPGHKAQIRHAPLTTNQIRHAPFTREIVVDSAKEDTPEF